MHRTTRILAAVGLALAAAAAPSAARSGLPRSIPVAAGQVQHTITETLFPRATNTVRRDAVRLEQWTSATAGRALESNATTHRVKSDCQFTATQTRCWTAPLANGTGPAAGVIHVDPGSIRDLVSWASVGQGIREELHQPHPPIRVTGTTTYLGRRAIKIKQNPSRTAKGGKVFGSMIIDAATYYPLRQEFVIIDEPYTTPDGHSGLQKFDEVTQTRVFRVLPTSGVQLTMAPHPGAAIVDDVANAEGGGSG